MRRWRTRSRANWLILALLVAVVGLGATSVARAYWRGGGGGASSATTSTAVAMTVTAGTPAASLFPGGRADVVIAVSNPNAFTVFIGSLALDAAQGSGGFGVDAGHSGCAVSTLSFTRQTNSGAGWTAPAKAGGVDGVLPITLGDAVSMGVDAADACQGATFTIYLAAGA